MCSVVPHEPRLLSAYGNNSECERLKQKVMREESAKHYSVDLRLLRYAFITASYWFNLKGGQVQKEFIQSALRLSSLSPSLGIESSRGGFVAFRGFRLFSFTHRLQRQHWALTFDGIQVRPGGEHRSWADRTATIVHELGLFLISISPGTIDWTGDSQTWHMCIYFGSCLLSIHVQFFLLPC